MANKKLTDLTELTTPADGDFLYIVDVSDTTESAQGTGKKIRKDKVDSGASKENLANKQNSLDIDGTGTKYPTVDAVNAETVKITGNQTIAGIKNFTSNIGIGDNSASPTENLEIKTTADSDMALSRNSTTNFARYYLKTGNTNAWSTGLRTTRTGYSIYNEVTATEAFTINSSTNNISIGKIGDDGIHKLQVEGGITSSSSIKVGVNTATPSASYVGSIRYRSDSNNSYVDMCMQIGASTYSWVNILQNNW